MSRITEIIFKNVGKIVSHLVGHAFHQTAEFFRFSGQLVKYDENSS